MLATSVPLSQTTDCPSSSMACDLKCSTPYPAQHEACHGKQQHWGNDKVSKKWFVTPPVEYRTTPKHHERDDSANKQKHLISPQQDAKQPSLLHNPSFHSCFSCCTSSSSILNKVWRNAAANGLLGKSGIICGDVSMFVMKKGMNKFSFTSTPKRGARCLSP